MVRQIVGLRWTSMKLISKELVENGRLWEGRETSGTSTSREKLVNFDANHDLDPWPFVISSLCSLCPHCCLLHKWGKDCWCHETLSVFTWSNGSWDIMHCLEKLVGVLHSKNSNLLLYWWMTDSCYWAVLYGQVPCPHIYSRHTCSDGHCFKMIGMIRWLSGHSFLPESDCLLQNYPANSHVK